MYAHIFKANPYHDALGRFSTKDTATYVSLFANTKIDLLKPVKKAGLQEDFPLAIIIDNFGDLKRGELFTSVKKNADSLLELLPENQLKSLKNYTNIGYININELLRGTLKFSELDSENFKDRTLKIINTHIDNLDKAIESSRIGGGVRLMRGISKTQEDKILSGGVGAVITDKGFQSFTMDEKVALGWNIGGIIKLNAKKEQKGVYVESITGHVGEEEILLPRNVSYVVTGVTKHKTGKNIISVEILEEKDKIGKSFAEIFL